MSDFQTAKKLGNIGEKYFKVFANVVTGDLTINLGEPERIEGWDNGRLFIYPDKNTGGHKRIEVKTIRNFLGRDNDGGEPTGTIPFELWNTSKTFYGWLYALIHPEKYNTLQKKRNSPLSVKPDLLVYALSDPDGRIFCFICFDFEELIDRLEEIEPRWSIKEWDLPMVKDRDLYGIIDNMWYVPFKDLQDLARVTMINYRNMKPDKQDNKSLQRERLLNLISLAEGEKGGGCREGELIENGSYVDMDQLGGLKQETPIKVNGSDISIWYEDAIDI